MIAPALILSAALGFQGAAGSTFVSKEGGFRVDMPAKPTERVQQMDTPYGPIEGRFFAATRGKLAFYATYSDFPPNIPDFAPEKVLDRTMAGAIGGIPGGTLQARRDIRLGEIPGKEFEFAYAGPNGEDSLCRACLYLTGTRLHTVMLRGPRADVNRVAGPFLQSFTLFPPEARAAPAKPAAAPPESAFLTRPGEKKKAVATKVFTSTAGGFRVAMPGKPKERTIVSEAPDGVVEAHLFVVVGDDIRRLVSYIDRPRAFTAEETDAGLEELVKGSIVSGKGTLVAKRPIRLGAAVGREFEFDAVGFDGRTRFVRACAYLVAARIYQVLIAGPREKVVGPPGDAYLNSFALIDPAPAPRPTGP